jgi:hypothetical protein
MCVPQRRIDLHVLIRIHVVVVRIEATLESRAVVVVERGRGSTMVRSRTPGSSMTSAPS